jgi:outer membrane protein
MIRQPCAWVRSPATSPIGIDLLAEPRPEGVVIRDTITTAPFGRGSARGRGRALQGAERVVSVTLPHGRGSVTGSESTSFPSRNRQGCSRGPIRLGILTILAIACFAQQPGQPAHPLTLAEAEEMALHAHPAIQSAAFNAQAAGQVITETRSAEYPTVIGSVTGAGAIPNSRLAAGALNNPVIYDRLASGFTASQLITDFGRTRNLVASAKLRFEAENQNAETVKDQVILTVQQTYFAVLRAQAVMTVADQTVQARQLVADQVKALAESKLKSQLDLSFANVNLSSAKLDLADAQNNLQSAQADFSTALGLAASQIFQLAEEPLPPDLPADLTGLIDTAIQKRPELASLRAQQGAAERFTEAERDLSKPTISALGSVGYIPTGQAALSERYGAAGVNVNIPIFNGKLFHARQAEAELRAQAAERNVRDLENRVVRDVRVSYLGAVNAYERLGLTAQLLDQAKLGLDLAQSRYNLGLGSIVELSQAQLNATSAEMASTRAKYDYQTQRAILAYQIGTIH